MWSLNFLVAALVSAALAFVSLLWPTFGPDVVDIVRAIVATAFLPALAAWAAWYPTSSPPLPFALGSLCGSVASWAWIIGIRDGDEVGGAAAMLEGAVLALVPGAIGVGLFLAATQLRARHL